MTDRVPLSRLAKALLAATLMGAAELALASAICVAAQAGAMAHSEPSSMVARGLCYPHSVVPAGESGDLSRSVLFVTLLWRGPWRDSGKLS